MIPEKNPYNNWKGNGVTKTFDFDFYIENAAQLAVFHANSEGVQTLLQYNIDYSINELQNENGSFITFPLASSSYEVLGEDETISLCLTLPIAQENPFGKSSYLNLEALEYSLDYLTRICQIMSRDLDRSVKVLETSDIETDKLVQDLELVADNIEAVSNVSADIPNIDAVNENKNNIDTCANSIVNINNTGRYIDNVNTAATNINNINTVAGVSGNVTTVADKITNVNTVATNIAKVNTAATNINNINTVAGVSDSVTTVANKIGHVSTAATNINNINTVAGVSGSVTTVANKIANVNTVATNIQAVDNCSDNMDAIKEAPDYAQFAADCLASCQSIQGQFGIVSFLSGGSSANILQEDIYDGGTSSVVSENVYSGGNSEYKNVLTYDDIKKVHEITALQALVKTLVNRIEALENIKTISGGVAVA